MTRFIEFTDLNNMKVTINPDYIIKFYVYPYGNVTTPVTGIEYQSGKHIETPYVNISYEDVKIKLGV